MAVFTAIGTAIAGTFFTAGTFAFTATVGIVQALGGIGLNLLASEIAGKPEKARFSIQGTLQAGADVPRSFIMGLRGTAGSLVYANTWGQAGKTPNAYLTQVICLTDLPAKNLTRILVGGELCTLGSVPDGNFGYPVIQYRKGTRNFMWVKFYDGTQTSADPLLVSQVSSSDRPYQATRVGVGCSYAVVTSRVDDELYSGWPSFMFEVEGMSLYDISRDDGAGGSGSHRWGDPGTWGGDGDHLPAVQAYHLLRGVTFNGQWFYGLQGMAAARLPAASWIAAVEKCRSPVQGEGGTEPQYRSGIEIQISAPVADAITALNTTCLGRIAEIGGSYEMHVGEPAEPGFEIDDSRVISTEEQSFTPFYGLADSINGIAGKYPAPAEGWATKVAPPIYRADYEVRDGNRRLMADVTFDAVPYAEQVQRLMSAGLEEGQRARRHTFTLPPEFWRHAVPNAVFRWTSDRNRYGGKLFRIDGSVDKANLDIIVDATEVDPSDYDWDHASDYVPPVYAPVGPIRPDAQGVEDWYAEPWTLVDAEGQGRRPAIRLTWDGDQDDVDFVLFEIRLTETGEVIYRGSTAEVSAGAIIVSQNLLPAERYEVRGRYSAISGRPTEWTGWLPVTTPDVRLTDADVHLPGMLDQIDADVREMLDWQDSESPIFGLGQAVSDNVQAIAQETQDRADEIAQERGERLVDASAQASRLRDLSETLHNATVALSDTILTQKSDLVLVREELVDASETGRTYVNEQIQMAAGEGSALVGWITEIEAEAQSIQAILEGTIAEVREVALDAVADEAVARQDLAIQLRGTYGGDDLSLVTNGLIRQLNQVVISETQALANAIALVSAGVGTLFDWSRIWLFDADAQGWTGNGAPTASGGWLRPADHADDPYVVSPAGLSIDGAGYRQVKLYIQRTGASEWRGRVWWRGPSDATWDASRRVDAAEPDHDLDGRAVLTVDMPWSGQIDSIRIDLSEAQTPSAYYEIDWIAVGRPSPGASQAQVQAVQTALASQIAAEAESRETLSVILTGLEDPTSATLPSLTSGLVFAERVARAAGDEALTQLIQAVAAQVEDPATGLDALAQAQTTMQGSIATLGDTVTAQGAIIDDVVVSIDGLEETKADASALDAIWAEIEAIEGTGAIVSVSQATRALQNIVERLAVAGADTMLAGKRDRAEVQTLVADVSQSMTSRIDATDEGVTLLGQIVDQISLSLDGYATLGITSALGGRITENADGIASIGQQILGISNAIETLDQQKADASILVDYRTITDSYSRGETEGVASSAAAAATTALSSTLAPQIAAAQGAGDSALSALDGYTGAGAVATAFSGLGTLVEDINGEVSAISESLDTLSAQVGDVASSVTLRAVAGASPGEGYARAILQVLSEGNNWRSAAGIYLDTHATEPSRIMLDAQHLVFGDLSSGAPLINPLVYADGIWRLALAHLGHFYAGIGEAPDGSFKIDFAAGSLEWFDVV